MAMMFIGVYASSSRSVKIMLSVVFSIVLLTGLSECIAASSASCWSKASYSARHLASHMDVALHAAK